MSLKASQTWQSEQKAILSYSVLRQYLSRTRALNRGWYTSQVWLSTPSWCPGEASFVKSHSPPSLSQLNWMQALISTNHRNKHGALSPPCWAEIALQRAPCQTSMLASTVPSALPGAGVQSFPEASGCQDSWLWGLGQNKSSQSPELLGLPIGLQRTAGAICRINQRLPEGT